MDSINSGDQKKREFTIVKNANDKNWPLHFLEDPREVGVSRRFSAYFSFDGRMAEIDVTYPDIDKAINDMNKILDQNPTGGYDICPVTS
jgi:hypothetical protein